MVLATLSPALGPLLVAGFLLVPAGIAKIGRPAPTAQALARAGLRVPDGSVRLLGGVELVLFAAAGIAGGAAGIPIAALYLAFAAFTARQVVVARRTGVAADCGCFGDDSAPVGWEHVAVNLALAAAGVVATVVGVGTVAEAREGGIVPLLAVYALAVVAAVGLQAVLTDLPRLRALRSAPTDA